MFDFIFPKRTAAIVARSPSLLTVSTRSDCSSKLSLVTADLYVTPPQSPTPPEEAPAAKLAAPKICVTLAPILRPKKLPSAQQVLKAGINAAIVADAYGKTGQPLEWRLKSVLADVTVANQTAFCDKVMQDGTPSAELVHLASKYINA